MQANRVNIDFEFQLFKDHYDPFHPQYRKFCREFEFVFFFMEKDCRILSTDRSYDENYLRYIEKLTGSFDLRPFDVEAKGWWGNLDNLPLEEKLNSKISSFQIANELGVRPSKSYLLNSVDEVNLLDKQLSGPCLLKSPFEMSGRGQKRTQFENVLKVNIDEWKIDFPLIIEPLHDISQDIGVRVNTEKGMVSYVELYNSSGGQFIGGKKIDKPDNFNQNLILEIAKKYQQIGDVKEIQIDCYRYTEGYRYLVEANHRKTMGDFIHSLTQIFGNGRLKSCSHSEELEGDVILLSPPGNMKKWYYEVQ